MKQNELTYEEAREQLEAIVKKVENNEYGIDELGARLKEALALVALCKKRLTRADAQIKELLGQE